jgi:predicted DCC family thiol-disulfide oxidoreductase YuxK
MGQSMAAIPVPDDKLTVVYDGDCPFCRNYVQLMALRKAVGQVDLVDARSPHPVVRRLIDMGFDLNEGMATLYGGKVYYGSDSVVLLSSMTHEYGWLGRLMAILLRNPARARLLYPLMKAGRRVTLRMLGKPLI